MAAAPEGSLGYRELGDGRCLVLFPLTFDRTRLCVGAVGVKWSDDGY